MAKKTDRKPDKKPAEKRGEGGKFQKGTRPGPGRPAKRKEQEPSLWSGEIPTEAELLQGVQIGLGSILGSNDPKVLQSGIRTGLNYLKLMGPSKQAVMSDEVGQIIGLFNDLMHERLGISTIELIKAMRGICPGCEKLDGVGEKMDLRLVEVDARDGRPVDEIRAEEEQWLSEIGMVARRELPNKTKSKEE